MSLSGEYHHEGIGGHTPPVVLCKGPYGTDGDLFLTRMSVYF